jgi:hypothetical protein
MKRMQRAYLGYLDFMGMKRDKLEERRHREGKMDETILVGLTRILLVEK